MLSPLKLEQQLLLIHTLIKDPGLEPFFPLLLLLVVYVPLQVLLLLNSYHLLIMSNCNQL
ncbi:MAG: hypothetical protein EBU92_15295 [Betaproteobacteria bacterium]|nr:hypothetical protein [Betaproteobacteria bacterium]